MEKNLQWNRYHMLKIIHLHGRILVLIQTREEFLQGNNCNTKDKTLCR